MGLYRAAANFEVTKKDGEIRARTYFFRNHNVVEMSWTPGKNNDVLESTAEEIEDQWPALKELDFSRIDAILPIPGYTNPSRAYFFSGAYYARVEYQPGNKVVSTPVKIVDGWSALGEVGFGNVDEAITRLDVGDGWNITFFFRGDQYCQVKWKESETETQLLLLDGGRKTQSIKEGWPGAGLTEVDTILPYPGDPTRAYAFSGSNFSLINLVDSQPHGATKARPVAHHFKSLVEAKFY
ncbi:hypothetical protein OPQ81_000224 [Rhizoctonia solani]|nr:hypothetical protein OPQ81_000224 [Rhizoctonia solani]